MICVTGGERNLAHLAKRLEAHLAYPLQEVRLDLLDSFDETVYPLLRGKDRIVTLRGRKEGGGFQGSESERLAILKRVLEKEPGYLDLEVTMASEVHNQLWKNRRSTEIILSWHDFSIEGDSIQRLPNFRDHPADYLKMAVHISDAAQLEPLLQYRCQGDPRPMIKIGMGSAGLLSRVLYPKFGSPWTYVVAKGADAIAPGQLTTAEAEAWRISQAGTLIPLCLIGGEQVIYSPGSRVYNTLFNAHQLPYIYLPVVTEKPVATLHFLEGLGFRGCSVTMPAKEILVKEMSELHPPADRLGALNTITLEPGKRAGWNTDAPAISLLLKSYAEKPALVLGSGGAARAAVAALQSLDCPVAVSGIVPEQVDKLALEMNCTKVPWKDRHQTDFQILVNATPCGADGKDSPMPHMNSWKGRVVLDAILSEHPTPLLRAVKREGGMAIPGMAWWLRQGQMQMEVLIGKQFTIDEMAAATGIDDDLSPKK